MGFFSFIGKKIASALDANTAIFSHPIVSLTKGIGAAEALNKNETGNQKALNIIGTTAVAAGAIVGGAAAIGSTAVRSAVTDIATKAISNPTVTKTAAKVAGYSLALGAIPSLGTVKELAAFSLAPVPAAIGTVQKFLGGGGTVDTLKDSLIGFAGSPVGETALAAGALGAGVIAKDLFTGSDTPSNNGYLGSNDNISQTPTTGTSFNNVPVDTANPIISSGTPTGMETQQSTTAKKRRSNKVKVQQQAIKITNKNYINNRVVNKGWI